MRNTLLIALALVASAGCEQLKTDQRTTDHQDRAVNLELQAKCAKDAKAWFESTWPERLEPNSISAEYTNHYSMAKNKCFITVEYKYFFPTFGSETWVDDLTTHDVYENREVASVSEEHGPMMKVTVTDCQVFGTKCSTMQEYRALSKPLLID